VQKVGFRLEIYLLAKHLNLSGWVKNNNDKSVETEIQGPSDKIAFIIEFMKSLKRASVKEVVMTELEIQINEKDFLLESD
jgi:acylphosphatase